MADNTLILEKLRKVVHDVKSPVVSMQSFLNLMELSEYEMSPEELSQLCETMKRSLDKTMSTLELEVKELKELLNS
jgi:hypothetical protein